MSTVGRTGAHPVVDISHYHGYSITVPRPNVYISIEDYYLPLEDSTPLQLIDGVSFSKVKSLHLNFSLRFAYIWKDAVQAAFERFSELRELSIERWAGSHLRHILEHRVDYPARSSKRGGRRRKMLCMPKLSLLQLDGMMLGAHTMGDPEEERLLTDLRAALAEGKKAKAQLATLVIREARNFFEDDVVALENLVGKLDWDGIEIDQDEQASDEEGYDDEDEMYGGDPYDDGFDWEDGIFDNTDDPPTINQLFGLNW